MIEADKRKIENEKLNVEKANCYKRMSQTKDGKKIMKDLEDHCGQNKSSVCRQSPNPYQTSFCEGIRSVYLYVNSKINRKENENGNID